MDMTNLKSEPPHHTLTMSGDGKIIQPKLENLANNNFQIAQSRGVSPKRILTTESSSGSDPLASPSNEIISDSDVQMEHSQMLSGYSESSQCNDPLKQMSNEVDYGPSPTVFGVSNPSVQARLTLLEKQFIMQREMLSRQFEEQCRLLDNEQQAKIQEYLKMILNQQQKDEMVEIKRKMKEDQMFKYKHKRKTEESAVASTAVKLKLRECLLNKSKLDHHQMNTDSPPELRQWSTQHSSLDQQSPPTNAKWSPPLHLLNQFEEEYPLRKTVSEPTLKMKSCKVSLRQRVMQRNNLLMRKRELYKKKLQDHDSSPSSPPLVDSHGSSIDEGRSAAMLDHRIHEVKKNTNITTDNKVPSSESMQHVDVAKRDLIQMSTHYGSLPLVGGAGQYFPLLPPEMMLLASSTNIDPSIIVGNNLNMSNNNVMNFNSFDGGETSGSQPSVSSTTSLSRSFGLSEQLSPAMLTEAYVQALMLASRSSLPRTRSEPIPLPVQLLLQQRLMKAHESVQKDPNKYLLKQKLLQQVGSKKVMENVDESVERQIPLQGCSLESEEEEEVDVIVVEDANINNTNKLASLHSLYNTGLAYDASMLNHVCKCQNNSIHPENPDRLKAIWSRFNEEDLINKCQLVKSRRAMREELQTCHSKAYVEMYGSNNHTRDPLLMEKFEERFCCLPCGGIGVDNDTVWNDQYTTTAARVAVGCAIELSYKVAIGELRNGFALVRPPGHHAEDTQAMGFCYFNSIGVATKLLLDKLNMKRILIVDWDVHHGNSTQQIFYADPRVLYISLHRYDNGNFFPGTGDPSECGIDKGCGYNINIGWFQVPMSDAEYLAAFRCVVMPIAREFNPELVMVSAGFDAAMGHATPLGGYNLSPQCFGHMTHQLMSLSNGKVVLVLEGGYELVSLADSCVSCMKALIGLPLMPISSNELCRPPCQQAVQALSAAIKFQEVYWPCLKQFHESISWSQVEAEQKWTN